MCVCVYVCVCTDCDVLHQCFSTSGTLVVRKDTAGGTRDFILEINTFTIIENII